MGVVTDSPGDEHIIDTILKLSDRLRDIRDSDAVSESYRTLALSAGLRRLKHLAHHALDNSRSGKTFYPPSVVSDSSSAPESRLPSRDHDELRSSPVQKTPLLQQHPDAFDDSTCLTDVKASWSDLQFRTTPALDVVARENESTHAPGERSPNTKAVLWPNDATRHKPCALKLEITSLEAYAVSDAITPVNLDNALSPSDDGCRQQLLEAGFQRWSPSYYLTERHCSPQHDNSGVVLNDGAFSEHFLNKTSRHNSESSASGSRHRATSAEADGFNDAGHQSYEKITCSANMSVLFQHLKGLSYAEKTRTGIHSPISSTSQCGLHLVGQTVLSHSSIYDLFIPEVVTYNWSSYSYAEGRKLLGTAWYGPAVQPLDVRSVWRGLGISQAEELLAWESVFTRSLELILSTQCKTTQDRIGLKSSIQSVPNNDYESKIMVQQDVNINIHVLADVMRDMWEDTQDTSPWFSSHNSVYETILTFIGTRDCFARPTREKSSSLYVRDNHGHSLCQGRVRLSIPWKEMCFAAGNYHETLNAEVERSLPIVVVEEPDTSPREGSTFYLLPKLIQFGHSFHEPLSCETTFSIEPSTPWLVWDDAIEGFKGIVPIFSEYRHLPSYLKSTASKGSGPQEVRHILCLNVNALYVKRFPQGVRFERTIRTKIFVQVLPWYAHTAAHLPDPARHMVLDVLARDEATASLGPPGAFPEEACAQRPGTLTKWKSSQNISTATTKDPYTPSLSIFDDGASILKRWGTFALNDPDFMSMLSSHRAYRPRQTLSAPRKQVDEYFAHTENTSQPNLSASTELQKHWLNGARPEDSASNVDTDEHSLEWSGVDPTTPWLLGRESPSFHDEPTWEHIEHARLRSPDAYPIWWKRGRTTSPADASTVAF